MRAFDSENRGSIHGVLIGLGLAEVIVKNLRRFCQITVARSLAIAESTMFSRHSADR